MLKTDLDCERNTAKYLRMVAEYQAACAGGNHELY